MQLEVHLDSSNAVRMQMTASHSQGDKALRHRAHNAKESWLEVKKETAVIGHKVFYF